MIFASNLEEFGKLSIKEEALLEGTDGVCKEGRDRVACFPHEVVGSTIEPEGIHKGNEPLSTIICHDG